MDTSDRFGSNLPVPFPAGSSLRSGLSPAFSGELATTAAPQINSRVLLRGLTRYWGYILGVSLLGSLLAGCLIWYFVEPTYEAVSMLRIEPVQKKLFSTTDDYGDSRGIASYLETQVNLITSNYVLERAVGNPSIAKLPVIKLSKDPKAELRKKMKVAIVEDAYLIRVALALPNPEHAATIVNAVVESYLAYNNDYKRTANKGLKDKLNTQLEKLGNDLRAKRNELQALHQKGTVDVAKPKLNLSASKSDEDPPQPTFSSLTAERVQTMVDQMVRTDLELVSAQTALDVRQRAADRANGAEDAQQSQQDADNLQTQIAEEFHKDPAVVAVIEQIKEAKDQWDRAKNVARLPNDSARRAAERQHKKLTEEYNELWNAKFNEIKQRLKVVPGTSHSPEAIRALKMQVEELAQKREGQKKLYEDLKIEKKVVSSDTFEAHVLTYDISSLLHKMDLLTQNLQQVEFETDQESFRVAAVDRAAPPKTADNNKLVKYLAAAPVGIFHGAWAVLAAGDQG